MDEIQERVFCLLTIAIENNLPSSLESVHLEKAEVEARLAFQYEVSKYFADCAGELEAMSRTWACYENLRMIGMMIENEVQVGRIREEANLRG